MITDFGQPWQMLPALTLGSPWTIIMRTSPRLHAMTVTKRVVVLLWLWGRTRHRGDTRPIELLELRPPYRQKASRPLQIWCSDGKDRGRVTWHMRRPICNGAWKKPNECIVIYKQAMLSFTRDFCSTGPFHNQIPTGR